MFISLVHPESPVDSCMYPPVYGMPDSKAALNVGVSDNKAMPVIDAPIKSEKNACIVYDCEIEPFEYDPLYSAASFYPTGEDSLNMVFGDSDLINSIMTSLEAEPIAAVSAQPVPMVALPPTPVVTAYPCIQKPGTFLNKDGRWIKGKPCRIGNCDKRAQSNGLCKGHGGGARCSVDGCSKSSQGGGLCRAHGGGKRCLHEGCDKGTQRNGFCYLHGGVRSCVVEGCERKDRGNGKCFAHGGGRRCQAPYCLTTIRKGTMCDKHVKTPAV